MKNDNNIYYGKDGRLRIYVKETKKTVSYPKYLMEETLGRDLLPNEVVHHIDENPLNNDISNLKLMTLDEHSRHHKTKYHDVTAVCGWCGKEFIWTGLQQQRFYCERRTGRHYSENPFCSRSCSGKYGRHIQSANETQGCGCRRKLTDDQIRYTREKYKPGDKKYGGRALAREFGVDQSVIQLIIKGVTYKDIY
jgi:hypothetical protein